MDDQIETLMVEVRASTSGFSADIESMRSAVDTSLTDGFARAGNVLERGLLGAIRKGSLGFDDFKQIALRTMNEIASSALQGGMASIFDGGSGGGSSGGGGSGGMSNFGLLFEGLFSLLGLPGRATGGPVSPGRPYLVGERGPELFVPTSAGRVETGGTGGGRDVRVAINLAAPRGTDSPVMLRRSTRQIASAVRRAMRQA